MKGQSFVLEFVIFFAISFSIFSTISFFFYNQGEYFKQTIAEKSTKSINNIIASNVIHGITCKSCDTISIVEQVPSKIGGVFYIIEGNSDGLKTTLFSQKAFSEQDQLFLLNKTFTFSGNSISENKKAEIKINNTNKQIEVI